MDGLMTWHNRSGITINRVLHLPKQNQRQPKVYFGGKSRTQTIRNEQERHSRYVCHDDESSVCVKWSGVEKSMRTKGEGGIGVKGLEMEK